jgi:hypothetical protein
MSSHQPAADDSQRERIGLCVKCAHARRVVSARGSTFWLCQLSRTDVRFPKYPPLPVLHCEGFQAAASAGPQPRGSATPE